MRKQQVRSSAADMPGELIQCASTVSMRHEELADTLCYSNFATSANQSETVTMSANRSMGTLQFRPIRQRDMSAHAAVAS